jgi:Domain of Unknown Function (DUF1080)
MIRILLAGLLLSAFISCNNDAGSDKKDATGNTQTDSANNHLSAAQKALGWELLFDGQTTNGWHKYGGATPGSAWKIAGGCLFLDTSIKAGWQVRDGGDMVSDADFENFHLKYDWKISKDGNSGVIFYVHEDTVKYKYPWETGPEMQVLDNNGHPDAKIPKHRAGDLYDLISCSKETVKPFGEWNFAEIKSLNGKLDFYLNGENVLSTTLWDEGWKKLVAGSKFKTMPDFGTYKKGRISLQDHGNAVWFRNVMIRRL